MRSGRHPRSRFFVGFIAFALAVVSMWAPAPAGNTPALGAGGASRAAAAELRAAATPDTWRPLPVLPTPRALHTAVWTGSEMIVWGGTDCKVGNCPIYLSDGARYNPSTDTWHTVATAGAPSARRSHTAVWTGTEMIVWGGQPASGANNTGGRYNPSTNSWTTLSTAGAPSMTSIHTAVWTGTEMIVWGSISTSAIGARYNPSTDGWTALPTAGAPSLRAGHRSVWTGSEMIIWGGGIFPAGSFTYFNDGARYNPSTNTWTAMTTAAAPSGRIDPLTVWSGSEMIIWGGKGASGDLSDGARYNPTTNTWTALPSVSGFVLPSVLRPTTVWTGTEMILWGHSGFQDKSDGARYSPSTNSWTFLPQTGAPAGRSDHTAVWSGTEMIIWGDGFNTGVHEHEGFRYSPSANTWTVLLPGTPGDRAGGSYRGVVGNYAAAWTGSEMIVWGGSVRTPDGAFFVNDGSRYNPTNDTWKVLPLAGAPSARENASAAWTGTELIIWGGHFSSPSGASHTFLNDGASYSPATNQWTALPAGGPSGRYLHKAVWTGTEMIIWGGSDALGRFVNSGARYKPSAGTWTALPTAGAPIARDGFSAVWTGTEMVIWGGYFITGTTWTNLADGARYNPTTDTWAALPTEGAPAARWAHAAAAAGGEMLVWGGATSSGAPLVTSYLGDGARYVPASNAWVPMAATGAPAARYLHTAVSTGGDVIVWGGTGTDRLGRNLWFNDGGIYSRSANTWTAVSATGAPTARAKHTASWTGSEMLVWGGVVEGGDNVNFGGLYTPPSTTATSSGGGTAPSVPSIASFSPTGAPIGSIVTITGANFTGATAVKFNGVSATSFTVTSATQITATVPTGATNGPISVTTLGGTATSSASFTVTPPLPSIASFSPTSGPPGTSVTITGANFTGATAVKFGGVSATYSVTSATQITATVPSSAQTGVISVTTTAGTGSSTTLFFVPPSIRSFSPTSGLADTRVTIAGTSFGRASSVTFNGVAARFTVDSNTQITAAVPSGATSGSIQVITPGGTATSPTRFVVGKPPAVTGFSPASGAPGTVVTITGSDFLGATDVRFNGVAAKFIVNTATQITASVPSGATTGPISVTNAAGTAASTASFVVAPRVTGFSPTSGRAGSTVTITGANFTGATRVAFGAVNASFVVKSATEITATVPFIIGSATISVTTPAGTATSATTFSVTIGAVLGEFEMAEPSAAPMEDMEDVEEDACPMDEAEETSCPMEEAEE